MKKVLFLIMLLMVVFSLDLSAAKMTGCTVIPSFSGPGLGVRQWLSPKWGWEQTFNPVGNLTM